MRREGNGWPTRRQETLLKACLFSDSRAQEAWSEWAQTNHIDPASYKLMPLAACNPALAKMDDPLFKQCQQIRRQTLIANRIHFEKAMPSLLKLEGPVIFMKGIAMILHYYKDFGARVIGDLDILIQRAHVQAAADFLHSSGWKSQLSRLNFQNSHQLDRWHAVNFIHKEGMNIDLHWSLSLESTPLLNQAVFDAAVPYSKALFLPNPTDLLLQTCIHGIKHCQVPLIRWVADAVTLLKQAEVDWDRLAYLAQTAHVSVYLTQALDYLKQTFEAPIPSSVLQKLGELPRHSLEIREYRANSRGRKIVAAWYRFCLRYGYLTPKSQLLHLHRYFQYSALLKSPLLIPFFGSYWIFTRSIRCVSRNLISVFKAGILSKK